jgi:Tfp pilus assembly protein PilN
MIKVNLVPGELLAKARQRQLMLQAALVGGLVGVVIVMVSFGHWLSYHNMVSEYNYKQSKLKDLGPIVSKVEDAEKAADAVRSRLGVIEGLLKGRAFYPIFMSEFAQTVPAGVKVTALSTSIQPTGSLKLSINASADSNDDVAGWMRTLEKNPHFAAVELGPVSASGTQYSFSITTMYTLKL